MLSTDERLLSLLDADKKLKGRLLALASELNEIGARINRARILEISNDLFDIADNFGVTINLWYEEILADLRRERKRAPIQSLLKRRAKLIEDELHRRQWTVNRLATESGVRNVTIKKILNGENVYQSVIEKLQAILPGLP
jgi:hypothetical protein